jgi:hypothetical protein
VNDHSIHLNCFQGCSVSMYFKLKLQYFFFSVFFSYIIHIICIVCHYVIREQGQGLVSWLNSGPSWCHPILFIKWIKLLCFKIEWIWILLVHLYDNELFNIFQDFLWNLNFELNHVHGEVYSIQHYVIRSVAFSVYSGFLYQ